MTHDEQRDCRNARAMTAPHAAGLRTERGIDFKRVQTFSFAGAMYEVRAVEHEGEWTVAAYLDGVRASTPFMVQHPSDELVSELMISVEDDVRKRAMR